MIASRRQQDISALLKQDGLTDEELTHIRRLHLQMGELGRGPLEPVAQIRQPYDSLYLKMKRSQEF